jgi:hypothetical protein
MLESGVADASATPGLPSCMALSALERVCTDVTAAVDRLASSAADDLGRLFVLDEAQAALGALAQLDVGEAATSAYEDVAADREETWKRLAGADEAELNRLLADLPSWAWWWGVQLRVQRVTALGEEADRLVAMRSHLRDFVSSLLDGWALAAHAHANEAREEADWRSRMSEALRRSEADSPRLLEVILADRVFCEAEQGASSLSDLADRRNGITLLGPPHGEWCARVAARAVELHREVSGRAVDHVLELFTPAFEETATSNDLLLHDVVDSFAAQLGVEVAEARGRRVPPPGKGWPNAACFDLGSFADPVWFVRFHGTIYDDVGALHELAHTVMGCSIRRATPGARLGLASPLVAEAVAYGLAAIVARDRARVGDEAALEEFTRIAAVTALGAIFVQELYPTVEETAGDEPRGEHVLDAWEQACAAVELTAEGDGRSAFLLVPNLAWDADMCRLHTLALAMASTIAAGDTDTAVGELVELATAWIDRGASERALARQYSRLFAEREAEVR